MQEEVHRFAIEYHRKVRGKNVTRSVLDEIDGIGPVRRKALLEAFGSIDEIKALATGSDSDKIARLAAVPGMDAKAADHVVKFFAGNA